jgi:hypothetical protein
MCWDAPVAISIFRRIRGKKRPAFCMSLYVTRDTLYIQQLQGVSRTDVPRDLGAWSRVLMEACRTFAYQEGFKQLRVPRAASLYSYHHPFIRAELLPDARERALQRIRKSCCRMRRRRRREGTRWHGFRAVSCHYRAEAIETVWTGPDREGHPSPAALPRHRAAAIARRGTQGQNLSAGPGRSGISCECSPMHRGN